jgi:DNA-directed RNA polymerase sigma subunit (sigma70/sigma32)
LLEQKKEEEMATRTSSHDTLAGYVLEPIVEFSPTFGHTDRLTDDERMVVLLFSGAEDGTDWMAGEIALQLHMSVERVERLLRTGLEKAKEANDRLNRQLYGDPDFSA